jgi:hypothetical protein
MMMKRFFVDLADFSNLYNFDGIWVLSSLRATNPDA